MDLSGSRLIPAPLESVRAGLQDPETLRACIPGCERLERTSDGVYDGTVSAKVGPIRAALSGLVRTADEGPTGWTLEAEGADAAAGSARGRGSVRLAEQEGGTLLSYEGSAEIEGKIGQLGSRLLTGVARQSIEGFLANFAAHLAGARASETVAVAAAPQAADAAPQAAEPAPPIADAPPLVHEEPDPAPTLKDPPPLAPPLEPAPIAPTAVPDVPDPVAIAAADAVDAPEEGGGSVGRIMLVAAIVVVVGIAIYFGFLQRPPTPPPA